MAEPQLTHLTPLQIAFAFVHLCICAFVCGMHNSNNEVHHWEQQTTVAATARATVLVIRILILILMLILTLSHLAVFSFPVVNFALVCISLVPVETLLLLLLLLLLDNIVIALIVLLCFV